MYRFIPDTLLDVDRLAMDGRLALDNDADDPAVVTLAWPYR